MSGPAPQNVAPEVLNWLYRVLTPVSCDSFEAAMGADNRSTLRSIEHTQILRRFWAFIQQSSPAPMFTVCVTQVRTHEQIGSCL
jgi:hypothetical protein